MAVGTGEQADGAAEPVPGEAGRGFGEGAGRAAGAGASGASVAAQNPEFGVRGAAGAGSGSAQSAFPACDPTGVVGVNSSPTIRGIGPVISMVLMTGIRDVSSVRSGSGATTGSAPVAGSAEASSVRTPRPG